MKLADLPQIRALSAGEKLELVDELWQEVARELERGQLSVEEKKLLDERWSAFIANPASALTLEQLQEKVKSLRR